MPQYLDFNNQEKGYKAFHLNTASIKANIGKMICYVQKRDIDNRRGYCFVRYAKIQSQKRNQLFLNEGHDVIDIRDVVECGIEIPEQSEI